MSEATSRRYRAPFSIGGENEVDPDIARKLLELLPGDPATQALVRDLERELPPPLAR